jgi:hypothetical protein
MVEVVLGNLGCNNGCDNLSMVRKDLANGHKFFQKIPLLAIYNP